MLVSAPTPFSVVVVFFVSICILAILHSTMARFSNQHNMPIARPQWWSICQFANVIHSIQAKQNNSFIKETNHEKIKSRPPFGQTRERCPWQQISRNKIPHSLKACTPALGVGTGIQFYYSVKHAGQLLQMPPHHLAVTIWSAIALSWKVFHLEDGRNRISFPLMLSPAKPLLYFHLQYIGLPFSCSVA